MLSDQDDTRVLAYQKWNLNIKSPCSSAAMTLVSQELIPSTTEINTFSNVAPVLTTPFVDILVQMNDSNLFTTVLRSIMTDTSLCGPLKYTLDDWLLVPD